MLEESAKVIAIVDNNVIVESIVKSSCSACKQVDNCGSGQVAKAIPHRKLVVNLVNDLNVKLGDEVILGIPEGSLLASAWQVYFLPLLGFILFAVLGQYSSIWLNISHEFLTIIAAFIGAFIGFKFAAKLHCRLTIQENLTPKLLRKQLETINIVEI